MNKLQAIKSNKHTTLAAVAYATAKLACQIASVWMPAHKDKFEQTASLIESVAVPYGLLMASDANSSKGKSSNDPGTQIRDKS